MNKSNQNKLNNKTDSSASMLLDNDKFVFFLFGLSLLIVLIARIHLLTFPFERDEGEYAYMGKLILDGHSPYALAYNMKYPGTYYMYALIMLIFGETVIGVHIGLTLITIASMFLMFSISRNFVSKIGAVIAALTLGVLGTSFTLLAQAAHATHFISFFALLGMYFILQRYKSDKRIVIMYLLSGISFSLAFICKQSGLFFVLFGVTVILVKEFRLKPFSSLLKNLALFSLGFIAPLLLMFSYFYFFGDFNKFWFWTYTYLSKYGGQVHFSDALKIFTEAVGLISGSYTGMGYVSLWIVGLLGIPVLFLSKATLNNKIIISFFFLFSFLTTVPGFYFRQHYFISVLPAIAILTAVFFDGIKHYCIYLLKKPDLVIVGYLAFILLIGNGIYKNKDYLFKHDKIAVLGSEPQIFFYADRYSASGYIYTYNLLELHPYALIMQKEMIREIETAKPKYLLFVNINTS